MLCFIYIKQWSFWRLVLKHKVVKRLRTFAKNFPMSLNKALSITLYTLSVWLQFVWASKTFTICLRDTSKWDFNLWRLRDSVTNLNCVATLEPIIHQTTLVSYSLLYSRSPRCPRWGASGGQNWQDCNVAVEPWSRQPQPHLQIHHPVQGLLLEGCLEECHHMWDVQHTTWSNKHCYLNAELALVLW